MARGGEPWIKPRACKSTDCPAGDHAPALALPGEFHTKRRNMMRFTIECDPDDLILAALAAKYGATKMPGKDAALAYGDEQPARLTFWVARTKTGNISVRKCRDN